MIVTKDGGENDLQKYYSRNILAAKTGRTGLCCFICCPHSYCFHFREAICYMEGICRRIGVRHLGRKKEKGVKSLILNNFVIPVML